MRLADLNPKWTRPSNFPEGWKTGISFLCPVCCNHRIAVMFDTPVYPDPISDQERDCWAAYVKYALNGVVWVRDGKDFDDLSLRPSINTSNALGCWHGVIVKGEVLLCSIDRSEK